MTKEIVSVQVGTNANYVGAHFWNLQDEYLATPIQQRDLSPAAMLCEISPSNRAYQSGLRYAPRLQIIDASGAFGALSTQAGVVLPSLPGTPTVSAWNSHRQFVKRDSISHSKYIRHIHAEEARATAAPSDDAGEVISPPLDDIRYWSDYFKVRLHPRTCYQLPGVHHQVSNLQHFTTGEQLVKPLLDDLYHDLRHFIEDCDSFGGLNIITNADDAFSGISATYLDHAVEELGSSVPIMVFGTHSLERSYKQRDTQHTPKDDIRLSSNEAQLLTRCIDYSAEYIPLMSPCVQQIPNLHVNNSDLFQASAALGLILDVALVPLRQRMSLSGMLGSIRPLPLATIGSIACNVPPFRSRFHFGSSLLETSGTVNLSSLRNVSPLTAAKPRGQGDVASKCFECVSARGFSDVLPVCSNVSQPVTLPIPFPPIFSPLLSPFGPDRTLTTPYPGDRVLLDQIAVIAGIGTVSEQGHDILMYLAESLQENVVNKHQSEEDAQLSEFRETLVSRAEDYLNL